MIKSMTGYGKAEAVLPNGKLTIEIKSLNGKNADLGIKSSLFPKDKELEVRSRLSSRLVRGSIDLFLNWEADAIEGGKEFNMDNARAYISQANILAKEMGVQFSPNNSAIMLNAILRMPEVVENKKAEVINEDSWPVVSEALDKCLDMIDEYRSHEGVALYKDVTSRVENILKIYEKIEALEGVRAENVRNRILKAAEELSIKLDKERFEQEMIYYLEKYDINEEKVRLREHCKYFMDTIDNEAYPGKKLGFIIQEMGREINTTGSKANHAEIQKLVVQMKDELEKIREQSMNIL